ncbi:hypothetical protein IOC62_19465 [Delftia sp. SD083]|nr:hypothetical protein [Delftia sp. SD083]
MKTWRAAIVGLCRWNLLLIHAFASHFTDVYAGLFKQLEIICRTSAAQAPLNPSPLLAALLGRPRLPS